MHFIVQEYISCQCTCSSFIKSKKRTSSCSTRYITILLVSRLAEHLSKSQFGRFGTDDLLGRKGMTLSIRTPVFVWPLGHAVFHSERIGRLSLMIDISKDCFNSRKIHSNEILNQLYQKTEHMILYAEGLSYRIEHAPRVL